MVIDTLDVNKCDFIKCLIGVFSVQYLKIKRYGFEFK